MQYSRREAKKALHLPPEEIERIVAHDQEHVMPYVWATGVDPDELERVVEDDPSIEVAEQLTRPGETVLYQMK
ncbi:bacterio-opsin activator domain-containing protein [Halalkalicoccus salilacus]|uniref:bacterio-opsin activator domain-containing protein n=1 Tax=Halalkalicoccus salilacus TaxID=3117459 RepID=UPI00300EE336